MLATQGTYRANVYKEGLAKFGLTQVVPDRQGQKEVTKVIYDGIKANNFSYDFTEYEKVIAKLRLDNNLEIIILGCTELSVAQSFHPVAGIFADPLKVIARRAIEMVGGQVTTVEVEAVAEAGSW